MQDPIHSQVRELEARLREQERVNRELAESHARLRAILDNEPECVKLLAADGSLLEMNPAGLRMIEADTFDEVRDHCVYPLIVEEHRDAFRALNEKVLGGGSGTLEFEVVGLKGGRRWLETHASPLRDASGAVTAMLGITRDITAHKQAEATLQASTLRMERLLESISDAFLSLDHEWRFAYINEKAAQTFGRPRGELLGKCIWDEFPQLVGQRFHRAYHQVMAERTPRFVEDQYAPQDRWFENRIYPTDEGISVFVTEITERKRAERALALSEARLAQQLAEIEQLYDTAPIGLALVDRDLRFVRINERLAAINGRTAAEHIGRTIEDMVPVLSGELRALYQGVLDTGQPVLEVEITGPNPADPGRQGVWIASYLPVHDKDGQVVGVSTVVADVTGQKLAGARLYEAQRIGRIGDWEYDPDSGRIFWSPQVYAMHGRDPSLGPPGLDEALGYYDPDSRAVATDHLARLVASGQEQHYELRARLPDGTVADHAVVAVPVLDHAGRVVRVRGIVQDITRRKQAEAALSRSERQLRMVMDGLGPHMFVGLMDLQGVVLLANRPARDVASLSEDDVLGLPVEDTYWFAYSDGVRLRMREAVRRAARGEQVRYDERIRVAEDQCIWIDFSLQPLHDDAGDVVLLVPSAIVIDERKRAEEALQAREAQLALVYDNIEDVVFVLDVLEDGYRFAAVNPRFLSTTGLDASQVVGQRVVDVIPEPSLSLVLEKYAAAIADGRRVQWEEVTPYPSGTKYGDVTIAPILNGEGRCIQLIGTVHDITARKHAEQQLREAAQRQRALSRRLVQVQEAEQRRISAELHDRIGQDLTALGIHLNIIGRSAADPRAAAARLEDSRILLENTIASLRGVIAELRPPVLEDYGLLAGLRWYGDMVASRAGLDVEVHGADPDPRPSTLVEAAFFRIAQEAMVNITKHAQARRVGLTLHSRPGRLTLDIVDDGIGFDLSLLRQSGPRAHWGLEMMRERAEAVGARLQVESTPGHGTRVAVDLESPE